MIKIDDTSLLTNVSNLKFECMENSMLLKWRRLVAFHLGIFFMILFPLSMEAQFLEEITNPQVSVIRQHPPGLGIKVNKVAFGPALGDCADEVVNSVISDLASNNIGIVDGAGLRSTLAEHNISLTGQMDSQGISRIEKVLGPSALVFIRVLVCRTEKERTGDPQRYFDRVTGQDTVGPVYYSKVHANLKVSVRTVDLTTGKIFAAQTFTYNPERSNRSYQDYPDFPGDFDVQNDAFNMLATDVHRMFLPWTDTTLLTFYNDKTCGLKAAWDALKKNDFDLAFDLSRQSLENCKHTKDVKERVSAHANYNMGICCMLHEDYDHALIYLQESARLKQGDIVRKAIANCREAKQMKEQMQRVEESALIESSRKQEEEKNFIGETETKALTNAQVISMTRQKVPESLIIQKIQISACRFNTSPDSLIFLSKSGVSEKVIAEMMNKQ